MPATSIRKFTGQVFLAAVELIRLAEKFLQGRLNLPLFAFKRQQAGYRDIPAVLIS